MFYLIIPIVWVGFLLLTKPKDLILFGIPLSFLILLMFAIITNHYGAAQNLSPILLVMFFISLIYKYLKSNEE